MTPATESSASAVKRRAPRPWWRPRTSRLAPRIALVLLVIGLVVGGTYARRAYEEFAGYPDRPGRGSGQVIAVEIASGSSFPTVLERLVAAGVVDSQDALYFRVFVLRSGAANKIAAGEHSFRDDMSAKEIVEELLRKPREEELSVTIPEGKHMLDVAQIVADAGLSTRAELEAAMRDTALLSTLKIQGPTAEGYLFPDTYRFSKRATATQIVTRLVQRHRQVWSELERKHRGDLRTLAQDFGWGPHEVVVLASIVEKETAVPSERPLIAGLFQNRLRFKEFKSKRLETDPTIIYGCTVPTEKSAACKEFAGRIRRIHLTDPDNPYNTYTHQGLPPGPISNPGREALEAVLAPTESRYLFFVAKNDGTHVFSKTVAEHEAWVDKYQRGGG